MLPEIFSEDGGLSFSFLFYVVLAVMGIISVLFIVNRGSKKNSGMLDELILGERQQNNQGYTSVSDKTKLLNKTGICLTDLRPAGMVNIDGEPVDVVTEGNFLKKGDTVKVINVDGSRVLVREIQLGG
ncbi:MAG: hypothetical protein K6G55_05180 [Selenomonadaceae bacterium]|nr:hypothetical protein [Selenomonadaceae bacterium]